MLLSGVFFAFKVMRLMDVRSDYDPVADRRTYRVTGQVFFASADMMADRFDLHDPARHIRIDLHAAHLWDVTAVGVLDRVVATLRRRGATVEVAGLDQASATLVDRHGPAITAG